ncbi:hypothetical protein B566_EDAN005590 [Ephemera danica]|nr:hypothetical protein B566_EDAN005590 [Ephemera danica]
MAAISLLNPKAEFARAAQALAINISAAKGIQDVMKTNLGPKGTMKMLVSGAGDIKITKDGNVLLHEMQIQHPTASLIARASTAQDDMTGDGTTSTVLVIGELLKQADVFISEGLHPRIVAEGFDQARKRAIEVLDKMKVPVEATKEGVTGVARTALRTKLHAKLADQLADVSCVNALISSSQHSQLLQFKGIDPFSLDLLAKEGILALRRAKRRNMERLSLACGGAAMNSFDDLTPENLGYAGLVYEHVLGEEKFTFVEKCRSPQSVTILMKGPSKHSLAQMKDAIRDGLRAIKNTLDDAFELLAHQELLKMRDEVKGKAKLGVQAYAEALLVIPKVLAQNAGFDTQDCLVKLQEEARSTGMAIGLDLQTGEALVPADAGIFDNYIVKKQIVNSCTVIASNLLLVDEIMRAGMSSLKG